MLGQSDIQCEFREDPIVRSSDREAENLGYKEDDKTALLWGKKDK